MTVATVLLVAAVEPASQIQVKEGGGGGPEPPRKPAFGQIFAKPTGQNGYEDYVLAADVMIEPKVREAGAALYARPPVMTPLAAKRAWVAAGRRALELVRAGNKKPIHDPREKVDNDTPFPEFAGFKSVANLFACEARVRFADGDGAGGTQSIVDCLTFAERIGHYSFLGSLVSNACTAIILAEAEVDLSGISQRDAQTLAAAADKLLQKPTVFIDGVRSDFRMLDSYYDAAVADVRKRSDDPSGDPNPSATFLRFQKELLALPSGQEKALKEQVLNGVHNKLNAVVAIFEGPEKGWIAGEPEAREPEDLGDFLVQTMMPVYGQGMNAAARSRTQLRLLRLHGTIMSFLWEHDRLPKNLDELNAADLTGDPIVGRPFHYQMKEKGGYDLWSEGWGDLGKIELKYRRSGVVGEGGEPGRP